jgi:23S rRNA pseudouridine2457 synthase
VLKRAIVRPKESSGNGARATVTQMLIGFHKPYGVLSRFTPEPGSCWRTLADFGFPPNVYPIGRLDADSEGLLLLSDEAAFNRRLLNPLMRHPRTYWVQVERIPTAEVLLQLASGLSLHGYRTRPCSVALLDPPPQVNPRDPPIRFRRTVPDCWLSLELIEGRNRQVRRMTAAVGHPTLRLIRIRIGTFDLGDLAPGKWKVLGEADRDRVLAKPGRMREKDKGGRGQALQREAD